MSLLANHGLIGGNRLAPFGLQTSTAGLASDTYVITPPATATEGNRLTVFLGGVQTRTVSSVPAGWTEIVISYTGGAQGTNRAYTKVAGAGEPSTYTFVFGASLSGGWRYFEWQNVDPVTPFSLAVGVGSVGAVTTISPVSTYNIAFPAVAVTTICLDAALDWDPDNGYLDLGGGGFRTGVKGWYAPSSGEDVNWTGASALARAAIIVLKGKLI